MQSIVFSACEAYELKIFSEAESLAPSSIWQFVWGLVLRCYSGNDMPSFFFENYSNSAIEKFSCQMQFLATDSISRSIAKIALQTGVEDLPGGTLVYYGNEKDTEHKKYAPKASSAGVFVQIWEESEEFKIRLHYTESNLPTWNITNIIETLKKTILSTISATSQKLLKNIDQYSEYDNLQAAEWMLKEFDASQDCVHYLVERQAALTPNAPAIASWDGSFSYAELQDLSSRLAFHLRRCGVERDVLVLISFEKSAWAIICMLSVLKAGGACVPVDYRHPQSRLSSIIERTQAKIMLATATTAVVFRNKVDTIIEVIPSIFEKFDLPGSVSWIVEPTDPAFVVFTSGSTGTPKGIVQQHGAFCSGLKDYAARLNLDNTSRVLQFAAFTFDASNNDIYPTLARGGCVCIPSESERVSSLAACITTLNANVIFLTPTVASLLHPSETKSLKVLALAGEAVTKDNLEVWADHLHLINIYGPAEIAIGVTYYTMTSQTSTAMIGHPVTGRCWIVDPNNYDQLVPLGAVGEILVEGPHLSGGYLRDPERTSESFGQGYSWATKVGISGTSRFYKTGDLAHWNSDGTISFLGRKDTQVKVRGNRVELGEIEYCLKKCIPCATGLVVDAIQILSDVASKTLTAFVCLKGGSGGPCTIDWTMSEILESLMPSLQPELAKSLPSHMIPSVFIPVSKLPLNPSGKIDRLCLRSLVTGLTENKISALMGLRAEAEQPQTNAEKIMQRLWSQALHVNQPQIGRNDNFFRLGGDSVAAMGLVALARSENLLLTVPDIFRQPTLSSISVVAIAMDVEQYSESIAAFSLLKCSAGASSMIEKVATLCGAEESQIEDIYPATPLQIALMALSARSEGLHISQHTVKLPVDVDMSRLKAACDFLLSSTTILRTRIVQVDSQVYQVVFYDHKKLELEESIVHLGDPVNMGLGTPLMNCSLVKGTSAEPLRLIWTMHHAVFDGWSLFLMLEKVEQLYMDAKAGEMSPYNSFVKHAMSFNDETTAFWNSRLSGSDPSTFPASRVGYKPCTNASRILNIQLPEKRVSEVTLATVLQASWALVNSQRTGGTSVVFGATISGRNSSVANIEKIIGPTISTVPIVIRFEYDTPVVEFLQMVQEHFISLTGHEHLGLQNISKLSPEAEVACDFQNLLVIHPSTKDQNPDKTCLFHFNTGMDREQVEQNAYSLALECDLNLSGVTIRANYDSSMLELQDIESILDQFQHIVFQLLQADTPRSLAELDLVSPKDKAQILSWNEAQYPAIQSCVHTLIEEQVALKSKSQAICSWDGDLSYSELDRLSSRLAAYLNHLGLVKPETFVPLCFEKSKWMIVAIIGVLKAGGAFVLLDPALPRSRLQTIVLQLEAPLILSSTHHSAQAINAVRDSVAPTVHLAVCEETFNNMPTTSQEVLQVAVKPENVAYVTFTSGSSGVPKGVLIEHQTVCSSAVRHGSTMGFESTSRVFQFSAPAFDAIICEVITTLIYGGCICIPSEAQRLDNLSSAMEESGTNLALLTPTVLRLLSPWQVPSLRILIVIGEAVPQDLVATWRDHCKLFNGYGPAECCVFSVTCTMNEPGYQSTQIGYSIGSTGWVVNASSSTQLVPIGCPGEFLIEGPILGRGYLNDEEKTRSSYAVQQSWKNPGKERIRLYKTGDLVKLNFNGGIEYIGRKDDQVKLHGQRIELGEVDHYAQEGLEDVMPGRKLEAASQIVFPKGDKEGAMLVLFICESRTSASDLVKVAILTDEIWISVAARLKRNLSMSMPKHIIPSAIIPLNKLPITTSDKIDRRKLRALVSNLSARELADDVGTQRILEKPVTDVQELMHKLWSNVLGIERDTFGLQDNFFKLGGDSIKAMNLVSLARLEGLELSVARVFSTQKLVALCSELAVSQKTAVDSYQPFSLLSKSLDQNEEWLSAIIQATSNEGRIIDAYPSTALQEGLFSLSLKQPGTYVAQHVFLLPRDIDVQILQASWNKMVEYTPILQTKIVQGPDTSLIQLVDTTPTPWSYESGLQAYLKVDILQPIEFGGPLSRCAIVKDSNPHEELYLVWTVHHALYDGWSLPLIFNQIEKIYEGGIEVPAGGTSLASFHRFLEYTASIDTEATKEFWREQLQNAHGGYFPSIVSVSYQPIADMQLLDTLQFAWKPQSGVTLPTTILAAFGIVLGRYSSSEDVVFGVTSSGRQAAIHGIEEIIGPTISTIPFRMVIDKEQPVGEFLQQTQSQFISTGPHDYFGLQNIRKLSDGAKAACDFQSLVVINAMNDSTPTNRNNGSLDMQHALQNSDQRDFLTYGLTVSFVITTSGVEICADFDGRVIEKTQVRRLLNQFKHVLEQLVLGVHINTVAEIEIFSPEDKSELKILNNIIPARVFFCVHDLVESQAHVRPHSTAIESWDGQLSYKALNLLSTQLAGVLLECGVKNGTIVPLMFEKSLWTAVAMLAILKAGAACVALDPMHPAGRLQSLITRLKATVALSSSLHENLLQDLVDKVVVVNEALFKALPKLPSEKMPTVEPTDAAFVICTSGSTGTPKIIILEHASICSSAQAHGAAMMIGPDSRYLQFAAYTFDMSISDMFTTLIRGGCVCMPSDHDRQFNLAGSINALRVNQASLTPTLAKQLSPAQVPGLRQLTLGGELVSETQIREWSGKVRLNNGYGPTECSIWSVFKLDLQQHDSAADIGVGVGVRTWVTEPNDPTKLAPIGCAGELLLEGSLLARGYYGDKTMTAAAFIEDMPWSFASVPQQYDASQRLYRTGDIVRYDSIGALNFLGRRDTQVKLRGQRIELEEVEFQIACQIPSSWDITVEVVEIISAGRTTETLVAFLGLSRSTLLLKVPFQIVWESKEIVLTYADKIESALSKALPHYMIPSIYVPLSFSPQTTSGKTDRITLRKMISGLSTEQLRELTSSVDKQSPVTRMEFLMRTLWAKTLNLEPESISLTDSFFRLGGNSITSTGLVAFARQEGLTIHVGDIFRNPKLADMSRCIELGESQRRDELVPFALLEESSTKSALIKEIASLCCTGSELLEDSFPTSPLQQGMFVLSMKHSGTYVAQHVTPLPKDIDTQLLRTAWTTLARLFPILRTCIVQCENDRMYQAVLSGPGTWKTGSNLDEYLQADKAIPMGFGIALSRTAIIEENLENRYFVWTAHHAIYDGWSLALIFENLLDLYRGIPISSPANFNSFIDYILSIDINEAQVYWSDQLVNPPKSSFLALPDITYSPLALQATKKRIEVPQTPASDITLPTVVRAAWALVCSQYTNQNDVVFGAILTGRNSPVSGIESMVGPCLTTVPIRLNIESDKPISYFLQKVQAQATAMIPFENTGLQNIRTINEDSNAACKFQSLLVVQPAAKSDLASNILKIEDTETTAMKFGTYVLTLEVTLLPDSLEVMAIFDEKVIDEIQIGRILNQFNHIFSQLLHAISDSSTQVKDLDMVNPQDLEELSIWNANYPEERDACVHDEIELQVRAFPDAEAICGWNGNLTYAELGSLSSRLALHLQQLGVREGDFVPLCFEKSLWAVIAMLGVVKAGAAFVPLEPLQPQQRLDYMVDAVSAKVILCAQAQVEKFSSSNTVFVVDEKISQYPLPDLNKASKFPTDAALYLIFTSGTSGNPKGCITEHAAFCAGAQAQRQALFLDRSSRVMQLASYSFDISIGQILTTLIAGGCICIPSEQDRESDISGAMQRMAVNWFDSVPSVVPLLNPEQLGNLKTFILGGEPLNMTIIRNWAHRTRLINAYGQTEACIISTANVSINSTTNPSDIGVAIGALCWVVQCDNHDTLVPIGAEGELLLEGPILARGYLNAPEQNSKSFVNDPDWSRSQGKAAGRRFYKTGDVVRYSPQGTLLYIGRKDVQLKIRGHRIEPAEVEHHMRLVLPTISDVVVDLIYPNSLKDSKGNEMLAAFVSTDADDIPSADTGITCVSHTMELQPGKTVEELEMELSSRLTSYMVPAVYFLVQKIPLTVSGKADRRKLRELGFEAFSKSVNVCGSVNTEDEDPMISTPTSSIIDPLANEIGLHIAHLIHSTNAGSFGKPQSEDMVLSRSGLDSIKMISLANFIRRQYGVTIRMETLFNSRTTVRELVHIVSTAQTSSFETEPSNKVDLMCEIELLDKGLREMSPPSSVQLPHSRVPRTVFLTGASGFLGTQILKELLDVPTIQKVIVLVRAATTAIGTERVIRAAKLAKWWSDIYLPHLEVWIGDLKDNQIGLTPELWLRLSATTSQDEPIDAIIHNGAGVNWSLDYEALRPANIHSTLALLKLSSKMFVKPKLTFVTGGRHWSENIGLSDEEVASQLSSSIGYSQTKFVAEVLVKRQAMRQGGAASGICIVRPGSILGPAVEGVANTDDYIWRVVAAAVDAKVYCKESADCWIYVSGSERISALLVDDLLERNEGPPPDVMIDVLDGISTQSFWDVLAKDMGYELNAVSFDEWIEIIGGRAASLGEAHPIWPVFHGLKDGGSGPVLGAENVGASVSMEIEHLIRDTVRQNVKYLAEIGFLAGRDGGKATLVDLQHRFQRSGLHLA